MKRIGVTKIYETNRAATMPVVHNQGGARSSKSYSLAQLFIEKLTSRRNWKGLITRKTFPALYHSAYKLMIELLQDYGYYKDILHNQTYHTMKYGSNYLLFASIDKPDKIKSTEFNDIWMEEANEFTWEDFNILKLRLSGESDSFDSLNHLYTSFNPSDISGWLHENALKEDDCQIIRSTYKDNPFLSPAYKTILEKLKTQDMNYYKIYVEGLFGQLGEFIYEPFLSDTEHPPYQFFDSVIYGLDFGYNNPLAFVELGLKDMKEQTLPDIWLKESVYRTQLTNGDFIELLKQPGIMLSPECEIFADPANPDKIEEIRRAGFNIKPAKNPVLPGIDFVKQFNIYSNPDNININSERAKYAWAKDKAGNILDKPIDMFNHAMDAVRYPLFTKLFKGRTQWDSVFQAVEQLGNIMPA